MRAKQPGTDARQTILATGRRIIGGKGFAAVGLNEILLAAGVPKGSFYHYFSSKEAFGEALLESYFTAYLHDLGALLSRTDMSVAERLMVYWRKWLDLQLADDPEGRCLAVKLGAEVADLSEPMRLTLERGTVTVIDHLAEAIAAGVEDRSIMPGDPPRQMAASLYQMWLGASLLAKISRSSGPLDAALAETARRLGTRVDPPTSRPRAAETAI